MDTEDRYAEFATKVDRFFEAVHTKHAESMQCGSGCSDCCHVRLTVTSVEGVAIFRFLMSLPEAQRELIAEAAMQSSSDRCAALADDGRCRIYSTRPIVCRSHGAPIRHRENSLPVIDACYRNFNGNVGSSEIDASSVFDQETLSTVLGALDAAFASDTDAVPGQRIDLSYLLAHPSEVFE